MANTFQFSNKSTKSKVGLVLILMFLSILIGFTLAFFSNYDFANKNVGMSGAVKIEAVGAGTAYSSIEDTETSNLVISFEDDYDVLIPGMEIDMPVNVKVYKSTTKPLIRARLDMQLLDMDLDIDATDNLRVITDLYTQMTENIEENNWYLHTDSYFYYVGDIVQDTATQGGGYFTL